MPSVAIVDDDPRVRDAARAFLALTPRFTSVGEAGTVADAIDLLLRERPELVLLDLGLPDGSGLSVLHASAALTPRPTAIVMTVFEDDAHIFDALRGGAVGYLLKHDLANRLIPSLDEATAGGAPMSPSIARRVLASFARPPAVPEEVPPLTAREREVTELLAHGSTYEEIGRMLGISPNTVRGFIRAIYDKLHVSSKTEAVREAMRLGIVPRP